MALLLVISGPFLAVVKTIKESSGDLTLKEGAIGRIGVRPPLRLQLSFLLVVIINNFNVPETPFYYIIHNHFTHSY